MCALDSVMHASPTVFQDGAVQGGQDLSSIWSICNSSIILTGLLARLWGWLSPFSAPVAAVFSNVSQLYGFPGLVGPPYQVVSLSLFEGKPLASNVNSPLSKPGSKGYILECSNLHHHNIIITTVLSGTVLHMQSHLIFSATPLAQGQYSNQQMCTLPPISPKEKGLQTHPLWAPWMFDSALFSTCSYGLVWFVWMSSSPARQKLPPLLCS